MIARPASAWSGPLAGNDGFPAGVSWFPQTCRLQACIRSTESGIRQWKLQCFFHFKSRAGGQGSNVMLEIARSLDTQLICICAKNEKLADACGKYRCGKTSED